MFHRFALAAAAAAVLLAGGAQAAPVTLSSVRGTWMDVGPETVVGLEGTGSSRLSWGTPANKAKGKSSYAFAGAGPAVLATGTPFDIGTFTHFNHAIRSTPAGRFSIAGASLALAVELALDDGTSRVINTVFSFAHLETPNKPKGGRCADGGRVGKGVNKGGCADRVTATRNEGVSDSFVYGGYRYDLELSGFLIGGALFAEFWTVEGVANSATLQAELRATRIAAPPPEVPLPAAGWAMLAGLGALAALRRRRA
jgi:hypothetical protein